MKSRFPGFFAAVGTLADVLREKLHSMLGKFSKTLKTGMKYLFARQMKVTYLKQTKKQQNTTAILEKHN